MTEISIAVEGPTDEAVLRRMAAQVGVSVGRAYVARGKPALLQKLPAYASAARYAPWVVLCDLDRSAECAPSFVRATLPVPPSRLRFRVAVRSVESWLLADLTTFSAFFGIAEARVPDKPDELSRPKDMVVQLCRGSAKRSVRDAMPPPLDATVSVGPGYVATVLEYVGTSWRPEAAASRSPSLAGALQALASLR